MKNTSAYSHIKISQAFDRTGKDHFISFVFADMSHRAISRVHGNPQTELLFG